MVEYAPTEDGHAQDEHLFWTALFTGSTVIIIVAEGPKEEHALVMIDASDRTGKGGRRVSTTRYWVPMGTMR